MGRKPFAVNELGHGKTPQDVMGLVLSAKEFLYRSAVSGYEADREAHCKFCIVGCIPISLQGRLRDAEAEVLPQCV